MKKNCAVCGNGFEDRSHGQTKKFCSKKCKWKSNRNLEKIKEYGQRPEVKEHRREYEKKYRRTPKGKEERKKAYRKYRQSPKGREWFKKYWKTKGKGMYKKYLAQDFGLTESEYNAKTKQCEICGWTHTVDLHHINGKKDNTQLIALCPNHHTLLHRKHLTIEDLKKTV